MPQNRIATALFFVTLSFGCRAERAEAPPPSGGGQGGGGGAEVPRERGPRDVRIADRIDAGAAVEGRFTGEDGVAVGYLITARAGASLGVTLDAAPTSEVLVYGPVDARGWAAAPVLGRGGGDGELAWTAPADGTYLLAALADLEGGGVPAAFTLTARCASDECRVQCAPDGACPTGAACELVQCVRAPCPSWCRAIPPAGADPEPSPAPSEPGAVGATCGTRGAAPCSGDLFCLHPIEAACGETDRPGTCQPRPEMCTRDYRPVCGCDGRTYGNECSAHGAGVSVRARGECAE